MVGDAQVLAAEPAGGQRHAFESRAAVAPLGMAMKRPAQVVQLDQAREPSLLGRRDLPRVLAQLRRNVIEVEGAKEIGLIAAANPALFARQFVLVQLEPIALGPGPQGDVVLFTAGEVVKGEWELLVVHNTEIG